MEMSATPAQDVYEIRPRKDRHGFDLIGDRLRIRPNLVCRTRRSPLRGQRTRSTGSRSRSRRAIIRVFNDEGNVTETHEQ